MLGVGDAWGLSSTASERPSLPRKGTAWSASASTSAKSTGRRRCYSLRWAGSLQTGSLQPNFFAADKDIAATLLIRDGFVGVSAPRLIWDHRVLVMVDQDPTTAFSWPVIAPESFDQTVDRTPWAVYLDLGGPFLVREIRLRHLADRPDHFLEGFTLAISDMHGGAGQRNHFA